MLIVFGYTSIVFQYPLPLLSSLLEVTSYTLFLPLENQLARNSGIVTFIPSNHYVSYSHHAKIWRCLAMRILYFVPTKGYTEINSQLMTKHSRNKISSITKSQGFVKSHRKQDGKSLAALKRTKVTNTLLYDVTNRIILNTKQYNLD